jgi:hypothetical protein
LLACLRSGDHCLARMSALDNLTPFAATCMPSQSRRDEPLTLVVVAGRFRLPTPGHALAHAPAIHDEQLPVRLADEHTGDPATSSLRHEGQSAYVRPGTDIYLGGLAWAPGGRPAAQSLVGLRVGACQKAAVVLGERVWTQGFAGVAPSAPLPFVSLPLVDERCFGGPLSDHNPFGRGLFERERDAIGQLLPNIEHPQALLQSLRDRPRPWTFGPLARHVRPRRDFAGTYDRAWLDRRIPLWPHDLDERFFCAAAPGLCAQPHLVGGEPVRIVGMSPDGAYEFVLPRLRPCARFEGPEGRVRRPLILDAVSFEPETASFTLVWRAFVIADPLRVERVVVRLLEPWEDEP